MYPTLPYPALPCPTQHPSKTLLPPNLSQLDHDLAVASERVRARVSRAAERAAHLIVHVGQTPQQLLDLAALGCRELRGTHAHPLQQLHPCKVNTHACRIQPDAQAVQYAPNPGEYENLNKKRSPATSCSIQKQIFVCNLSHQVAYRADNPMQLASKLTKITGMHAGHTHAACVQMSPGACHRAGQFCPNWISAVPSLRDTAHDCPANMCWTPITALGSLVC